MFGFHLEHNSHTVKVGFWGYILTLQSLLHIEGDNQIGMPIWNYAKRTVPWHPGKVAKWDRVIQLNCGEVHTHASYKTTRTQEYFDKWGATGIEITDFHMSGKTFDTIKYLPDI